MKTVPASFLLAFIAGCGVFLHHVTDDARRPLPPRIPVVDLPEPPTGGELKATFALTPPNVSDAEYRAAHHRHYAGKTGGYFARLGAELAEEPGHGPSFLIEYWAAADAAGLLLFAEKNPRKMPLADVLSSCALHDPAAVLAFLRRLEANKANGVDDLWKNVWSFASKSRPGEILAIAEKDGMLKTHPGRFAICVAEWAARDPKAALAFAQQHGVLLQSAVQGWSQADPAAAMAWMKDSGTAVTQPELWQNLILNYARSHPKEAAVFRSEAEDQAGFDRWIVETMIDKYPLEAMKMDISLEQGSGFFVSLTHAMARRTPDEAAAFIKALPAHRQLDAYDSICGSMSWSDPRQAVKFCTGFPDPLASEFHDPNNDPAAVFTRLAREDPGAAIGWMTPGKIPDALRERVLPQIVDAWMGTDREAATRYLQRLPPSELKGRILMDSSHLRGEADDDAVRDYIMTLTDTADRVGASRLILQGIGDATQKKAWIAGIPDSAVRKIILTPPPPPPEPKLPQAVSGEDPFSTPADPFAK